MDAIKAVEWFRKAAAKGNAGAQYSLGAKYASGSGVAKNPTQSAVKKQRGQHVDAS